MSPDERKWADAIHDTVPRGTVAEDVAGDNIIELQEMDHQESASLFRSLVIQNERMGDIIFTYLLNELNNLTLAIGQAVAFLYKNEFS